MFVAVGLLLFATSSAALNPQSSANSAQAEKSDLKAAQFLYGTWYSYPPGNPANDSLRHEFKHNPTTNRDQLTVMRLCSGTYRGTIARATSPVVITQSTIRVLKAASNVEKGELNSECKASIEPGLWSYTISDDHDRLTITNPGGTPDIMELARQDAAISTVLPSNVYGTWLLPQRDSQVQLRLVFYASADSSRGKVRQIARCAKGDDAMVSQADADIRVSADQITILNAASHVQKDGPFICKVTITPGTLHYVLSPTGDTMTLTSENGPSLKLTRDPNAGLN